jgi:hypothetical protein
MRKIILAMMMCLPCASLFAEGSAPKFDAEAATRFARLALTCVDKEYPNKISHVLNSDEDVAPPRKLTPAFCGCYDWHSSVHGLGCWRDWRERFPKRPSPPRRGKPSNGA